MILDPINDVACLGQLTTIARELARTTLINIVARRLGSVKAVVQWIQSLPQDDDDGSESVRYIECDVPQRVRLLPDRPNCVERSVGALMLFEVLDPKTSRALATIDRPMRHTGLVEKRGARWHAVDLFPRRNAARNFDWGEFGKDVLQGVHTYVGKPVLTMYGMGSVADTLGEYENKAIGRDKPKQQQQQGKQPQKKEQPPAQQQARPQQHAKQQQQARPQQQGQRPVGTTAGRADGVKSAPYARFLAPDKLLAGLGGAGGAAKGGSAGAPAAKPNEGGGRKDAEAKEQDEGGAGAAARPVASADAEGGAGDGGDPHDEGEEAERGGAERGPWWGLE